MNKPLALALALAFAAPLAGAATKVLDPAIQQANTRYAEDKKLCVGESSSSARMQCLRDAKAEYDKSVAAAKAAAKTRSVSSNAKCPECGRVLSVDVQEKEGEGSALGMIAGGVAGAVLGHQVGGGTGKDLATIAGAAGGAYAGNKIEKKVKSSKVWIVAVRFDNGEEKSYTFSQAPGFAAGDSVKASNDSIVRR